MMKIGQLVEINQPDSLFHRQRARIVAVSADGDMAEVTWSLEDGAVMVRTLPAMSIREVKHMDADDWQALEAIVDSERCEGLDDDDVDQAERVVQLERIGDDLMLLRRSIEALEAEGYYCWGDFSMTCAEADALFPFWTVVYGLEVAEDLLAAHVQRDEPGDKHYQGKGK